MSSPANITRASTSAGCFLRLPLVSTQDSEPTLSINPATSNQLGAVKPDNTTIVVGAGGVLSAVAGSGPAVTAVTGVAPIVSSGGLTPAISVEVATTLAPGVVKPDGVTILIVGGQIVAVTKFLVNIELATATASGTTGYLSAGPGNNIQFGTGAISARYLLMARAFVVTRLSIYSDVGPQGIGEAATVTISLVAQPFTPGTAAAFTFTPYALVDSDATATVTGASPFSSEITAFSVSPLVIPANSLVAWESVTGGGTPTTAQMNFGLILTGYFQ